MDMHLLGRRALVCGGSRGIGFACALAFADEGAEVTIVGRDQSRLDVAVTALRRSGPTARSVAADLADPDATAILTAAVPDIDILVTNAGISPAADILRAAGAWEEGISAIVARPMELAGAYLAGMVDRGYGRVINITSSAFAMVNPNLAFSGALRAALTHAAANLARQVAAAGVTVNNIAPGPVESNGLTAYFARIAHEQNAAVGDIRAQRLMDTPTRRFLKAEEIGRTAVFLASPHASSLTGRTMLMDGGANPYPFL